MHKDFDSWNKEKKIVDRKTINQNLFFREREIWWCSTGLNVGVEADGKNENFERPMLIIKKFNSEMLWILPLTSREGNIKYHFRLSHGDITSYAILSQIKTISTKRLLRRVRTISGPEFYEIVVRVVGILEKRKPPYGGNLGGRSH